MKIYYPLIKDKIKLNLINYKNENLIQPFVGLDFFYLKLDKYTNLHIPSNTQLSEFLNKFNESEILPKLGENKLESLKMQKSILPNLDLLIEDYGWNWINWNSAKGKKVFSNLEKIQKRDPEIWANVDRKTKEILGRIKLKESTDYGTKVESDFNKFLIQENNLDFSNYSEEVKDIYDLMIENNLVVIAFKEKFVHPKGIFWGEIDYILMDKNTKKIYLADLKTSYSADNYDYWRQLAIYHHTFSILNPHIKKNISDEVIIIHVSKLNNRNTKQIYKKNINENRINEFVDLSLALKEEYINELKKWNKKKI